MHGLGVKDKNLKTGYRAEILGCRLIKVTPLLYSDSVVED